jgi:hypothetical protein
MLRITESRSADGETLLRLEGRLMSPELAELSRKAHPALREGSLVLDLRDVSYASAPARALLRALCAQGAQLVGCPPDLTAMLEVDLEGPERVEP